MNDCNILTDPQHASLMCWTCVGRVPAYRESSPETYSSSLSTREIHLRPTLFYIPTVIRRWPPNYVMFNKVHDFDDVTSVLLYSSIVPPSEHLACVHKFGLIMDF